MKARLYIIPVAALILGVAISYGVVLYRQYAVVQMFNNAGLAGKPVIVLESRRSSDETIYIASPDSFRFRIPRGRMNLYHEMAFTLSGDLLLTGGQPGWREQDIWGINFPNLRIELLEKYSINEPMPDQDVLVPPLRMYLVYYENGRFSIRETHTGEAESFPVEIRPPFRISSSDTPAGSSSPDRSVIVLKEPLQSGDFRVWKCDLETGFWEEVLVAPFVDGILVGSGGKVIAVTPWLPQRPCVWRFYDGTTGNLISTETGSGILIGRRWIALIGGLSQRNRQVVLFDLDGEHGRQTIQFPRLSNMGSFAMYEPPSGGWSEMLEMRE